VRSSDGNSRPDLNIFFVHGLLVQPRRKMSVWVHRNDLLLVVPLWERTDVGGRLSVCEVWLVRDVKVLTCYSKRVVDRI
jgi:hypothetical protein